MKLSQLLIQYVETVNRGSVAAQLDFGGERS